MVSSGFNLFFALEMYVILCVILCGYLCAFISFVISNLYYRKYEVINTLRFNRRSVRDITDKPGREF